MTSWIGKSIAHYRVSSLIGSGGMGEVYRAGDSRLGRDVAIKVLPAEFASDQERMARFEREAKLLASLSHAGIAAIFGLEDADGARALVMELVEGPTLAERIAQGALPIDEALPIARRIAEALEYAHERVIIHRDLKPQNIKLTPDGGVKVLDFGLAKALSDEVNPSGSDLSRSPTLTAMSTRVGVILGTAAYMSPEQAKGKAVDRRADIWSFGAVLFEMLSGRQPFEGETVSETLASVMKDEPDWSALPASTPPRVRDLLRRCLVKDPRQRLRDIGDARIRLDEELSGAPEETVAPGTATATIPSRRGVPLRRVVLVTLVTAAIGLAVGYGLRAPAIPPMFRATLTFPDGMALDRENASMAIAPDGRMVAFSAAAKGEPQRIWLRRLDSADATPLEGTDGATYPFWSPDGRSIGFFADRKLKRIPASGGVVQTLCDAVDGRGASWSRDGRIVFAPGPLDGLHIVPAGGGVPQAITTLDKTGETHRLPRFLPDGERLLFVVGSAAWGDGTVECLNIADKKRTPIMECQSEARYLEGGHLGFLLDGNLVVQRFDPDSLALSGDPVPVAQDVQFNLYRYTGSFDLSASGVLVYATGAEAELGQPTSFALDGKELGKIGEPRPIQQAALSPDGRRLVTTERSERFDLWMLDVESGVHTRFTFGPEPAVFPVWSADGRTVYYADAVGNMFAKSADGSSPATRILEIPNLSFWPYEVTPDGKELLFLVQVPDTGIDIRVMRLAGDPEPRSLIVAPGNQDSASFSPDGRWLAFATDESGRSEVVVVPYPSLSGRWQVSSRGGSGPEWLPDGRGILYGAPDGRVMRVDVDGRDGSLVIGAATPVFGGRAVPGQAMLAPDGTRLLAIVPQGGGAGMTLDLVTDWRRLLNARDGE